MSRLQALHIGIVGACGRGRTFATALAQRPGQVCVQAVCDMDADALPAARDRFDAASCFQDYEEMLSQGQLDIVVIATPMHLHAQQSIQALDAGLHVLCEVTPAVSVEECRQVVSAARQSTGQYMLAENCNYTRQCLLVEELVRQGLFGSIYYAEAEYLHEVRDLNERTKWRRRWQTGIDGIPYGTHALGPVLCWMPGERVHRVCCAGSGHHYEDPRGDNYHQDTHVMLAQTEGGGLIKIRLDMVSTRPSVTTTYQLQGTTGCYESARRADEQDRIWLTALHDEPQSWGALADLEEQYFPTHWRDQLAAMADQGTEGHSGSDAIMSLAFIDALLAGQPPPVDIDRAMDMSLPGLVSQESMRTQGAWLDVPDSRQWGPDSGQLGTATT
ncbi:MAG: Gfo/Idh/MocA family oxidoreductase [Gemmatimonadetes bacterium]|nr:Gfo/Idh/MocA family oxidoreductase [Gemmatimonadota bacterium]